MKSKTKRLYISPYLEIIFHLTKCSIVITKISLFPFAKTHSKNKRNNQTPNSHFGEFQNEFPYPFFCVFLSFSDRQRVEQNELPLPFSLCFSLFYLLTTKSWTKWISPTFSSILHQVFGGSLHTKPKNKKLITLVACLQLLFFHPLCWTSLGVWDERIINMIHI